MKRIVKNTEKGKFILVLGGACSGKSSFAERLATSISENVTYIATANVSNSQVHRRAQLNQLNRPSHWTTYEESSNIVRLVEELKDESQVVLVDCLTLWLSNLLINSSIPAVGISWPDKENFILKAVESLGRLTENSATTIIVVADEVSLGLVPDNRLGKSFRDVAGLANQILTQYADEVYLTVAGLPIEIKSLARRDI